jgi:hypothetical protein
MWAPNYDGSRYFLALALERPDADGLNKLLRACNRAAVEEGHPPLYASAPEVQSDLESSRDFTSYFHFSLAWCLATEVHANISEQVLEEIWQREGAMLRQADGISVHQVLIKIGNAVHSVELSKKAHNKSRSTFG